jgi:hypothetical protein
MHRPRGSIDRCSRARHWASKGSNRGWGATQCPTRELDLSDRRTSSQGSSLIQCRTPNGQSSVRHEQGGRSVCPQAAPLGVSCAEAPDPRAIEGLLIKANKAAQSAKRVAMMLVSALI